MHYQQEGCFQPLIYNFVRSMIAARDSPDKNTEVVLSVDNILDRKDNLSHSSSYYYSAPVNYLLSFSYKF